MKKLEYTITYNDGKVCETGTCPAPDRLPQPGDIYEFQLPAYSLGKVFYAVGDCLEIVGRTTEAPHFRSSSLGNLIIRYKKHSCEYKSIWTNIEWLIAEGTLKLLSGE